jgi:hypothetical protein
MSKLHLVGVGSTDRVVLPEEVQLSLAGIAGQAKEGLLALAVATSLGRGRARELSAVRFA